MILVSVSEFYDHSRPWGNEVSDRDVDFLFYICRGGSNVYSNSE